MQTFIKANTNLPNNDGLIIRPSLFFYVNKNIVPLMNDTYYPAINKQFSDFHIFKDFLFMFYNKFLINSKNPNVLKKSILVFPFRVPEIENTKFFLDKYVPFEISLLKLKRIKNQKVSCFSLNFNKPFDGEMKKLKFKTIEKFSKNSESFLKYFEMSEDKYLRDVPMIAIYFSEEFIPSFCYKKI